MANGGFACGAIAALVGGAAEVTLRRPLPLPRGHQKLPRSFVIDTITALPLGMAGDVYTQPPYVGRGGWSWYTGAAAWLHRAAIGSILGLRMQADSLSVRP